MPSGLHFPSDPDDGGNNHASDSWLPETNAFSSAAIALYRYLQYYVELK
ncbi:MAG: hypothetical protein F6K00_32480 [Leptolyngbya sp. SIOISBB]|nr:hypothetical protein [Leptolyngbya sp. SIOISBB]